MTPFDLIGELWLDEYDDIVTRVRRLGIAADAEDVATEVFLELADMIKAGHQSTEPTELRSSLRTRAYARAMNAHEAADRTERLLAALCDTLPPGHTAAPRPDSFVASTVNDVLYELPRLHAQTFILAVLRGCSADETATLTGVARRTVYRWVMDIGDTLQRELA